jgi:DHA3 family multidrug efflux protein-like MFS transporter
MDNKFTRAFYFLLGNTLISTVTNMTVWFAIIFFAYLETQSVLATSIISGIYLISVAFTGFWFGSIVDNNKKKNVMMGSSAISLIIYIISFLIYITADQNTFKNIGSPTLWIFVIVIMVGVIAGNLRGITLPTVVTLMIPEEKRDRANGLVGTATGLAFLVVSVFSGILVGHSGMFLVLILAILFTVASMVHLWFITIPEREILKQSEEDTTGKLGKIDIRGTIRVIKSIPGLMSLIFFTTFNNFLGGVFMALMDAYGLSIVSVEVWGVLWGVLSTAFIFGGIFIAKRGLGNNPLKTLFTANIIIWSVSTVFTIQPSIALLMVGMFIYLFVAPFIEASEHTIIQKVVEPERQGRVFGFAQSIEQAASPLTAFLIGPIAQFFFIPFMTDGAGAKLIGSWYGTGPNRGIALVFTVAGIIGLTVTLLATRSQFYKNLTKKYINEVKEEEQEEKEEETDEKEDENELESEEEETIEE